MHAIGNLDKELFQSVVEPDSYLDKFFRSTKAPAAVESSDPSAAPRMTPDKIAQLLREDTVLDSLHSEASALGQSLVPDEDEPMINHFICFRYSPMSVCALLMLE